MSAARGQGDVRKRRLARLRARIVYLLARLNERSGWRMSKAHRDAYERSQGRRGARSVDAPILLLTTRGARSGRSHTVPVCCVPEPDGWVVASHAAGSGREPQWARNVAAGGSGEVLISGKRYRPSRGNGSSGPRMSSGGPSFHAVGTSESGKSPTSSPAICATSSCRSDQTSLRSLHRTI